MDLNFSFYIESIKKSKIDVLLKTSNVCILLQNIAKSFCISKGLLSIWFIKVKMYFTLQFMCNLQILNSNSKSYLEFIKFDVKDFIKF